MTAPTTRETADHAPDSGKMVQTPMHRDAAKATLALSGTADHAEHIGEATTMIDHAELARRFHDTYERLAPSFGYETRPDTKAFDPESPNGRLMTAVCNEVEAALLSEIAALRGERDRLRNRVSCLERLGGEQSTRVMEQATRAKDAERQRDELRKALEQIADEAPYRSGYCQSDVEYGPALSADEMQAVARQAVSNQGGEQ